MAPKAPTKKRKGKTARKAFKHEGKDYTMTLQQQIFAYEYVKLKGNGQQAAIAAGYSARSAAACSTQLLKNTNVSKFIETLKSTLSVQLGISIADIGRELAKIAFADVRRAVDADGNVISVSEFDDMTAANIASIEVVELYEQAGKGIKVKTGYAKKLRFYNKIDALVELYKMLKPLKDTEPEQPILDGPVLPEDNITSEEVKRIEESLEQKY